MKRVPYTTRCPRCTRPVTADSYELAMRQIAMHHATQHARDCPSCKGWGIVNDKRCWDCKGAGKVSHG